MKVISKLMLPIACLFAATTVVSADFDRELWEEVPAAMVNHGVGAVRRDLAALVNADSEKSSLERRAKWMYNNHVGTWYSGHDLQNPMCFKNSSPHISDWMRIAAIKDTRKCFHCIKVSLTRAHPRRSDLVLRSTTKHTIAKIIDYCAGCDQHGEKVNDSHIDLSKGAFRKLAPLSAGEVPISWSTVRCYKSKYWPRTPGKKY
jgi:hypothetical protein